MEYAAHNKPAHYHLKIVGLGDKRVTPKFKPYSIVSQDNGREERKRTPFLFLLLLEKIELTIPLE